MSIALGQGSSPQELPVESLWRLYSTERKKSKKKEIRDALITSYLYLVKIAAGRLVVSLSHKAEYDDLVGYGMLGLLDAIDRFQPDKGVKFETFAFMRIRGAILDGIRGNDWVPRSVRDKARKLEQAFFEVEQRQGRSASDAEVASFMNLSQTQFEAAVAEVSRAGLLSLDELLELDDEGGSISVLGLLSDPDSPDPAVRYEQKELRRRLAAAIDELQERERLILALYYYEELTVKEIAEIMGISESRVSQLHTKALLRIHGKLKMEEMI
ncbi:MAG TPA: FliA/WhiG family RNA polymerase sigma factor [Firmicutes bacterium]|nr:FliA/WhiG family RNA polymerase sigma factor [Bacillota bacterium]HHY97487.1 FliA/WhiG family RNA polymerase sigma factor [Bacillota bacterium]